MEGVRSKFCGCCLVVMVILSLRCVNSRPFTTHSFSSEAGTSRREERAERVGDEVIGSRPPRCEHRCNGCTPCEATQVPTNHHLGIQFANYEPEGWKCKCGPSFYTP